jgi:hypothetical protein
MFPKCLSFVALHALLIGDLLNGYNKYAVIITSQQHKSCNAQLLTKANHLYTKG